MAGKFYLSWQPVMLATNNKKNSDHTNLWLSSPANARSRAIFVGH
jgi:hypothetical protein